MARSSSFQWHSPARVVITRILLAGLVAASVYLIFEFGRIQANYNIVDAGRERQTFENRIAGLDTEIATLKQAIESWLECCELWANRPASLPPRDRRPRRATGG